MIYYTFLKETNVFLLKPDKKCYGFTTRRTEPDTNNQQDLKMPHLAWNGSAHYPIKEKEQTK